MCPPVTVADDCVGRMFSHVWLFGGVYSWCSLFFFFSGIPGILGDTSGKVSYDSPHVWVKEASHMVQMYRVPI